MNKSIAKKMKQRSAGKPDIELGKRIRLAGHLETAALRGGELKGSPPGWPWVCRMCRPHDLKGGRMPQRAERNADDFGLDEEMLRATG